MEIQNKTCRSWRQFMGKNLFLCSFILLWVYYIFLYPTLSYASEVNAEHGANYLYNAYNNTFRGNVWMPDAGYLVWLPRFIGLLVSAFVSPYLYIYITNFIGLAFIAFFVAFLNHRDFRKLIPCDRLRFLFSVLFGMIILPKYEIFTFLNFSYIGFIFVAFLLFLNKKNLPRFEYTAYSILCALLCISKFHFVVFLPFFVLAVVYHLHKKEYKSVYFYVPVFITIAIQFIYIFYLSKNWGRSPFFEQATVYHTDLKHIILKASRGLAFWTTAYATHFRFLGQALLVQPVGLGFAICIFYWTIKAWQKRNLSTVVFVLFITFNFLSLGFGVISSLSYWSGITEAFFENQPYPLHRRGFISYDMIWFACCLVLINIKQLDLPGGKILAIQKFNFKYALLGGILILSVFTTWPKIYSTERTRSGNPASLSDWSRLYSLFDQDAFYIPCDPFPFGLYEGMNKNMIVAQISDNSYFPNFQPSDATDGAIPNYDQTAFTSEGILLTPKVPQAQQQVQALIIGYPHAANIYAMAYNEQDELLGQALLMSHPDTVYKYLIFEQAVTPAKIAFFDESGQPIGQSVTMASIYALKNN